MSAMQLAKVLDVYYKVIKYIINYLITNYLFNEKQSILTEFNY
jgi:hypothetical protein